MDKYTLRAINEQGAGVTLDGNTKKELINKFDAIYSRRGFVIEITNNYTGQTTDFKKSFR